MMTLKTVAKLVHQGTVGRYRDDAAAGVIGLYLCVTGKGRGHFELTLPARRPQPLDGAGLSPRPRPNGGPHTGQKRTAAAS